MKSLIGLVILLLSLKAFSSHGFSQNMKGVVVELRLFSVVNDTDITGDLSLRKTQLVLIEFSKIDPSNCQIITADKQIINCVTNKYGKKFEMKIISSGIEQIITNFNIPTSKYFSPSFGQEIFFSPYDLGDHYIEDSIFMLYDYLYQGKYLALEVIPWTEVKSADQASHEFDQLIENGF